MTPGKKYKFSLHAVPVLGIGYENVKLEAAYTFDKVSKFFDAAGTWRNVYPLLPVNTVNDFRAGLYYEFTTEAGDTFYLSEFWIDTPTIEEFQLSHYQINVFNVNSGDAIQLRNLLSAAGYVNFDIKVISA